MIARIFGLTPPRNPLDGCSDSRVPPLKRFGFLILSLDHFTRLVTSPHRPMILAPLLFPLFSIATCPTLLTFSSSFLLLSHHATYHCILILLIHSIVFRLSRPLGFITEIHSSLLQVYDIFTGSTHGSYSMFPSSLNATSGGSSSKEVPLNVALFGPLSHLTVERTPLYTRAARQPSCCCTPAVAMNDPHHRSPILS